MADSLNSFILATYNLRCPSDKTPPHTWSERKDRCRKVVAKNDFDIFGVQEPVRYQIDDLIRDTGYAFIGGGRDDFQDQGEFSAIIYKTERFEVLQSGTFGLSETPDIPKVLSWDAAYPRIATWGLFRDRKSGKEFVYYNTHLDHISELARINGFKLLVEHAQKNVANRPVIITGDFNTTPGTPTYLAAAALLNDAAKVTKTPHTGPGMTFNYWGTATKDEPIDYIFVSSDIRVLTHRTDDTRFPEGFASDHYPVIAELQL